MSNTNTAAAADTNTTVVTFDVAFGEATFAPVLLVADNGRWSISDDGLEAAVGREEYSEWLLDMWARPEVRALRVG